MAIPPSAGAGRSATHAVAGAPHATVERVTVSGFRTVRHAELRLGPVTALVGEASAGKSNLLAAIALLTDAAPRAPTAEDVSPAANAITVDAVTSSGRAEVRYRPGGEFTRGGSWPVALLPSALRDGSVIEAAGPASSHAAVAAVARALREQATHGDSPAGRARSLLAAVEDCCDAGVAGVLLLIEEPELYLRPQAQRYLYRLLHRFAAGGNQVVYSTHAPAFLNVARLEELAVVARDPHEGTMVHQAATLPASDGFRAMSEFDAERGELFLADVAVLVEGRTEKLALPHVFRALGVDVDRAGISIVECGGKANLPIFVRLCQATAVPFVVVHDRDAPSGREPIPSERSLNELLRSLAGEERVTELAPDFEAVAGLRRQRHKPEQAWEHFRRIVASDVPDGLRRVVEAATRLAAGGGPRAR
ncbi:MAG: ATP-dependent nuclease [Acidimicrobiia bacterium]